jgi:hypothetical protein
VDNSEAGASVGSGGAGYRQRMSEPNVPSEHAPADAGAPVVRDEETGEQRYPEQHGGARDAPFDEETAEAEGKDN